MCCRHSSLAFHLEIHRLLLLELLEDELPDEDDELLLELLDADEEEDELDPLEKLLELLVDGLELLVVVEVRVVALGVE